MNPYLHICNFVSLDACLRSTSCFRETLSNRIKVKIEKLKEVDDIKEILDAQKEIDEVIVANRDGVHWIDRKLRRLQMLNPNNASENVNVDVKYMGIPQKNCRYLIML